MDNDRNCPVTNLKPVMLVQISEDNHTVKKISIRGINTVSKCRILKSETI